MHILLVEDEKNLNQTLLYQLRREGFEADGCYDGEEALYYIEQSLYDMIILDRILPGMDGFSLLQKLRSMGNNTPVILLTALGTLADKVQGLNLGADDYMVKPFSFEELHARIRALERRPRQLLANENLTFGDLVWNGDEKILYGPAGSCTLSKKEGALIEIFLKNPGITLSRTLLLNRVWGLESDVEEGNVDNYILFLRRRLTAVGSASHLKTIRGVGFALEGTIVS